jgi:hypothetical protein
VAGGLVRINGLFDTDTLPVADVELLEAATAAAAAAAAAAKLLYKCN